MDRRLHAFLLNGSRSPLGAHLLPSAALAQDAVGASADAPQVVEPKVARREVKVPAIDAENFEGGLFIGTVSIEDFGSSFLYGGRVRLPLHRGHVRRGNDRVGQGRQDQLRGPERLGGTAHRQPAPVYLLRRRHRLERTAGRSVLRRKRAMPSAVYFTLGVGSTRFARRRSLHPRSGCGFAVLVNDWLAAHLDARGQTFDSDLLGKDKLTQNLQFRFGLTAFF